MWRILQRYILFELLKTFVLSTAAITLFLALAYALGELRKRGLGPIDSAQLVLYFIPSMLVFAMPVGALLTSTLVYGRLTVDNELTACRASGISLATLLRPVLILGLLIALLSFILFDHAIPWARYQAEDVGTQNMERIFFHSLRTRMHISFSDFFLSARHVQGNMLYGVVLRYDDPGGRNLVGYAPAALVRFFPPGPPVGQEADSAAPAAAPDQQAAAAPRKKGEPTQEQVVRKYDCWDAKVVSRGRIFIQFFRLYSFDEGKALKELVSRGDPGFVRSLRDVRVMEPVQMTLGQLRQSYSRPEETFPYRWAKEQEKPAEGLEADAKRVRARALAEMHSRYASMLSSVLLVGLGAALGVRFRHGHILTAFFISMGPALFAIFAILFGSKMVKADPAHMHNLVAVIWAGNLVVLVIDVLVISRLARQ